MAYLNGAFSQFRPWLSWFFGLQGVFRDNVIGVWLSLMCPWIGLALKGTFLPSRYRFFCLEGKGLVFVRRAGRRRIAGGAGLSVVNVTNLTFYNILIRASVGIAFPALVHSFRRDLGTIR